MQTDLNKLTVEELEALCSELKVKPGLFLHETSEELETYFNAKATLADKMSDFGDFDDIEL